MHKKNSFIAQLLSAVIVLSLLCVIPVKRAEAASGSILASSTFISVPSGLGSVTISWDTSGCSTAQVYICEEHQGETLWSQNPNASQTATWINPGRAYTFRLYANTDKTELLDTVTVVGYKDYVGAIGAKHTEVIIPSGSSMGTAEITWGVGGYSNAQVYVKMDNNVEQLYAQALTGTSLPSWIQDGHKYQFNLYANTNKTSLLDSVTVYGRKQKYEIGVNYHAYGSDFDTTSFLREYHSNDTFYYNGSYLNRRQIVQSQLQQMANQGINVISSHLWMVVGSGTPAAEWKWHFPPTNQELANLRTFSQDVAAVQATDGHRLKMNICLCWIWASSFQVGSPSTTLGHEHLSVSDYNSKVINTYQGVLNAVYNVYRPDGEKVMDRVYLDGEVMIGAKSNQDWFLSTHYPGFVNYCNSRGVTPSLYFLATGKQAEILDDNFVDATYPALNGHRSMYWVYRSLYYMKNNGLHMPDRIDWSTYVVPTTSTYSELVNRVFDDAEFTLTGLGCRKWYSAAETFHLTNNYYTEQLGAAFAAEGKRNNRVSLTNFWTTPDGGGSGIHIGFPFDIELYLP